MKQADIEAILNDPPTLKAVKRADGVIVMTAQAKDFRRLYDAFLARSQHFSRAKNPAGEEWFREAANALVCACVIPEAELAAMVGNDAMQGLIDSYKPEAASLTSVGPPGDGPKRR
jgi:hypothetical protein